MYELYETIIFITSLTKEKIKLFLKKIIVYLFSLELHGTNCMYMTGLLHEGIFNVQDLLQPAIFGSSPWAYVMCNWAQILIRLRH